MLNDILREYAKAENALWLNIRDNDKVNAMIKQGVSEEILNILENLIKGRVYQLMAFEILLKVNPDRAIKILKSWYLSLDLSNHVKDQVSDLAIMFSDIREILGNDKFQEVLNCPEFLPKNKRNWRVKEAIAFALDED